MKNRKKGNYHIFKLDFSVEKNAQFVNPMEPD